MTNESFLPVRPSGAIMPKWVHTADYKVITPKNVVAEFRALCEADEVSWDTEYKSTHSGNNIRALQYSLKEGTGRFLPVRMRHMPNLELDVVERFVRAISKKRNICQAARAEMLTVRSTWPHLWQELLNITDDIQVVWYQRDPNDSKDFREKRPGKRGSPQPQGFSLPAMARKYLKIEVPDLGGFFNDGGDFADLDPQTAVLYGCSDVDVTLRLYHKGIDTALRDSFIYKLDIAVLPVLQEMELQGLRLDKEQLATTEREVRTLVDETRAECYKILKADPSVNIDSTQQLAKHLFDVLNFPLIGRKGKKGYGSTDKNARNRWMQDSDPTVSAGATALHTYKTWKTLHNNFLTKLPEYVNPLTGAVHCSLISTVVPTGRLACASPNLQQIPQSKKAPIRRAFVPTPGFYFIEADYSQIELRVFAGETQDNFFFDAFLNNVDLHLKTASVIFREEITDKNDPRRAMGKVMNFGPIYGMEPAGLAMRTDYDIYEAERILDDFWSAMPDAIQWVTQVHNTAKQKGGVHTHFGRWRPLPWLSSRNPHEVAFGERSAVNTIVQGTAADIMKIGLIRLHRRLAEVLGGKARMVLTVHDSVLLEVADELAPEAVMEQLEASLCFPIENYPPLQIDAKMGRNWFDLDPLESSQAPAPAPVQTERKNQPLPQLTDEALAGLIALIAQVKTDNGHIDLYLTGPSGELGPFPVENQGYTAILQYLVNAAKEDSPGVPTVTFA